jgi:hypothetical protein
MIYWEGYAGGATLMRLYYYWVGGSMGGGGGFVELDAREPLRGVAGCGVEVEEGGEQETRGECREWAAIAHTGTVCRN